jgi:glycosyltransferase involved in cell wall biosynthesis
MFTREAVPILSGVRIALVSTPFASVPPVGYGGTELVVHELATGLRAAGHEVLVFATGDSPGARSLFKKPVWPPDAEAERLHARAAAREIARGRWDVVHAHTPSLLAHADHLGAPLVYTLHHARDEALARVYERAPRVRFVAISARQAALHPELACHVIHHGLEPRRFPAGEGAGDHVAFLGRLSWCKGPDAAVEAARRAGVPILVAGEPHDDDAPEGWRDVLAAALRAPHVKRLGAVSGARKLALLADARAFVAPLRWEEPFGLALVEAMLCGTPVVAYPRGAVPEIVDEGVTGFLVHDVDEMAAVLASIDGFDRAACRRRAQERFGAGRMVAEHLRLYASVAAEAWPRASAAEESCHAG